MSGEVKDNGSGPNEKRQEAPHPHSVVFDPTGHFIAADPIPFVLDTGAADVLLPADVVFTLLRTGTLHSSDFTSYRPYILADGRELPSAQFKIRELKVGQHTARNVISGVGRLGSDALLGQSFLSRFGSATIDYKRNVLVLSR